MDGGATVRLDDVIARPVAGRPAAVRCCAAAALAVIGALAGCSAGSTFSADSSPASAPSTNVTTAAATSPTRPRPGGSRPSPTVPSEAASTHRSSRPATPTTVPTRPDPNGQVSGATIALNPGHNGGDVGHAAELAQLVPSGFGQHRACDTTGTNTDAGYPEHAFTWDVTLRVRRILNARGVRVILTRPNDTGVGPCIDTRARTANAPGVAAVISIHADGGPAGGHGFHICEDSREPAGPVIAAASHRLTTVLHDALVRGSGLTTSTYLGHDGYYPRSDLAGLNLATVPATFIELGNMRNAADAARQSSPAGRARMAAAVAAGILDWLATR